MIEKVAGWVGHLSSQPVERESASEASNEGSERHEGADPGSLGVRHDKPETNKGGFSSESVEANKNVVIGEGK